MPSALEGLRVVEVGEGKALAYCGKLLRDLGAEVIKVEPPDGDTLRSHGPFPQDVPDPERSGLFIYFNGGKRGARHDLATDEGRAGVRSLLEGADLLLHSLPPSEARAAGLEHEQLQAERADLIVAVASTYGHTGPYAEWKGHAIQAYAGSGVSYRVGEPDREPLTAALDGAEIHHGAVQLAGAILVALHHRARTGRGQLVDVGSLEAANVAVWGHGIPQIVYLGLPMPLRNGNLLSGGVWGVYPTKDGHFALMTQVERHWTDFLKCIGDPEWGKAPLVANVGNPGYRRGLTIEEGEELHAILRRDLVRELRRHTNAELWEMTRRERISFQPVLTIPQVCEADHVKERGWLVEAPGPHPPLRVPGAPYRFAATPWQPPGPPPALDGEQATTWEADHHPPTPFQPPADRVIPPNSEDQPLAGVRILDLGQVWAGPLTIRYLADFGADVIKVQTKTRPWMSGVPGSFDPKEPLAWEWILRNRRSITMDLRRPEGAEVFRRLAAVSDIVLENYGPGTIQRLGLDYPRLAERNPGLIMISMPPAGSTGPWSDLLSYGPSLTGLNGMKALNGYPEDGAVMEEAAELDPIASAYGALALMAALAHRNRTGEGQHIELAQAEAGFAGLAEAVVDYMWNDRDLGPRGNTHRFLAPHGMYPTAGDDQWIAIACASDEEWHALAREAGHAEWLERPEFATAIARREARHAIDAEIGAWTRNLEKHELTDRLQAVGVPAFPVLDAIEVIADPMLAQRRRDFDLGPSYPGPELLNGIAWHLSESHPRLRMPASEFDAHNAEVLGEYLGIPEDEVRRMEADGTLA